MYVLIPIDLPTYRSIVGNVCTRFQEFYARFLCGWFEIKEIV